MQQATWDDLILEPLECTLESKFGLEFDCAWQCPPWSNHLPYDTNGLNWSVQAYLILPPATDCQTLGARESCLVDNVYYNIYSSRMGCFIDPSLLQLTDEQK